MKPPLSIAALLTLLAALLPCGSSPAAPAAPAARAAETASDPDALVKRLASYRFGDSRADLTNLERLVGAASADPAEGRSLAAKLAALLDSDGADDGKQFALRMLARIGGPAEAPALARRLADPKLGLLARFALERIPGPESLAALREALKTTTGETRIGLIDSLGARRDQQAIPALAQLLSLSDLPTVNAAIRGLGAIGGDRAAQTLLTAEAALPTEQRRRLSKGLLRCAESLLATGHTAQASALFERLLTPDRPRPVRIAAFLGRVAAQGEKGFAGILAALSASDPVLQTAAVRALSAQTSPALYAQVSKALPELTPAVQTQALSILAEREQRAALPAALSAVASADPTLAAAALSAVGALGDASCVAVLVEVVACDKPAERRLAVASLIRLRGPDVDAAILAALPKAAPSAARELISVLVGRSAKGCTPVLLAAAASSDSDVRRAALAALGKVADASEGPRLLALLDNTPDADELCDALAALYARVGDVTPLIAALEHASGAKQAALAAVLGRLGGGQALAALRGTLASKDAAVRTAAVRALADWPDAAVLDDLVAAAVAATEPKCKTLALRGIARLAPLAQQRPVAEVATLVAKGLAAAERPEETRSLLAALGKLPCAKSLHAATTRLNDSAAQGDAALAISKIIAGLDGREPAETAAAVKAVRTACGEAMFFVESASLPSAANLARGAKVVNLDGLRPEGEGQGPEAAIDGDPRTFWAEAGRQRLYWLQVTLPARATVAGLRITALAQHQRAPRDFEVLCDGKPVRKIVGAIYNQDQFGLRLPPTACQTIDLKITDAYGVGLVVREFEVFGQPSHTTR